MIQSRGANEQRLWPRFFLEYGNQQRHWVPPEKTVFQGGAEASRGHRKDQWAGSKAVWVCFTVQSVSHTSVWVPFPRLLRTGVHLEAEEGHHSRLGRLMTSNPAVVCRRHQSREEVVSVVFLLL